MISHSDCNGVNFLEQQRATMVAKELGWVGFAADIYGPEYHTVDDSTRRHQLASMYHNDNALFAGRIQAAVDFVKTLPGVDPTRIALAGYSFGGTGVLTYALLGLNDVAAIVSLHGSLVSIPVPSPAITVRPKLLILSGGDDNDDTAADIMHLEKVLDSANATWEITRYSGIQHAFTALSDKRYDPWTDMRSWESMHHFLQETFHEIEFTSSQPKEFQIQAVPYEDVDGTKLQGYLAMPSAEWRRPLPAVVIIPDWNGVDEYEKKRATMLASMGYVAFAADIVSTFSVIRRCVRMYATQLCKSAHTTSARNIKLCLLFFLSTRIQFGADRQGGMSFGTSNKLMAIYNSNSTLYIQRIQRAMRQVKTYSKDVSMDDIAIIGYCFGGR
jgi:dienelactone hydrolase